MTGDGTNDALALHEADIGLAMGISGTEVAKESSYIIILDDNFASVVKVVRWGRSVYANRQKFIQFQLTVNVAVLVIKVVAAVSSGDVPLNGVQLLWVDLIMDTLGILALATEPLTDHLMRRTPVGQREPLITNIMWRNLLVQPIYQVGVFLVLNFGGKTIFNLEYETLEYANEVKNTLIFNTFVLCQVAWEHEQFSRMRVVAATISGLSVASKLLENSGGLSDSRHFVDETAIVKSAKLVAESTAVASMTFDLLFLLAVGVYLIVLFSILVIIIRGLDDLLGLVRRQPSSRKVTGPQFSSADHARLFEICDKYKLFLGRSFILGRSTADNIIIVYELMYKMRKSKSKKGAMILKIDLEKAYDRVNWDFLRGTLYSILAFRRTALI